MCELFAMSSRTPSVVSYSLEEFAKHGGQRYSNRDGWGIVFYEDRDAHHFKEPCAAASSDLAQMIAARGRPTKTMISHVRLATAGDPALENTHPFRRIENGRAHHFAHNGDLEGLIDEYDGSELARQTLGDTDSELAFVILMERLAKLECDAASGLAPIDERFDTFASFAGEMASYGSANFLYSDGDALFIHADQRRFENEQGELEKPSRPPGLNIRHCAKASDKSEWQTDGARIEDLDPQTILVASVPLNDEGWEELPRGCAMALKDGEILARRRTYEP
ncbi:class II glutamine amidotransferase [Altererythrobacter sp.]|nr:class II glutamine amidotransferase [Altererythrobacter sp.]